MSVFLPFPRLRLFGLPLATALLAGCASVGPTWHGAPVAAPNAAARVQFLRAPADANADAPAPRWWLNALTLNPNPKLSPQTRTLNSEL